MAQQQFDIAERFSRSLDEEYGTDRRNAAEEALFWLTENPSRKFGLPLIALTLIAATGVAAFTLLRGGRTSRVPFMDRFRSDRAA